MFLELSEAMNLHQDECYSIFNVTINFQISCLDFLRVIAIKIIQYNVKKKKIEGIASMISFPTIITFYLKERVVIL